ncbi:BURP domain-containing protein BNM2A-like isoform X2 [Tripterygium wilfordii]|nr:BURP domain-containing protein BNM2A-like isoform X2 [Tripterygium wilfordii]
MGFLGMDDIYVGNTITINLPFDDPSSSPHFIPREEADSLPFSSSNLQSILDLFSIPQGSPHAKAMQDTIRRCETLPMEGEAKTCANSLESLLDYVNTAFGQNSNVKALTTTHDAMSTGNSNKYRILEVKEIPIRKMMGCHVMRWPYAVYYCHHQMDNSETKVFNILLGGDDDGDKLDAFAACHMDTSKRDPNQLVFKLLNTMPGRSSPVCHVFPEGDLIWVDPIF